MTTRIANPPIAWLWASLCCIAVGWVGGAARGQDDEADAPATSSPPQATESDDTIRPERTPPAETDQRSPTPTPRDGDAAGRMEPDVYLLPDADGKLQAVLGFAWEDFREAWRAMQGAKAPERRPRFSLSELTIDGKQTAPDRAELSIRIAVELQTDASVEVPLGLGDAILIDVNFDASEADDFVHFDQRRQSYVAWLQGKPGDRRVLSIRAICRLDPTDEATQLSLALPRAIISRLAITVPAARVQANASDGAVTSAPQDGGTTKISVLGAAGAFTLAWSPPRAAAGRRPLLEATGAFLSTIDGRGMITNARLTIRSLSGSFDRCQVRLPRGAQLRSADEADFTWQRVDNAPTTGSANGTDGSRSGGENRNSTGPLYEFQFGSPQTEPVELQFVIEQPLDLGGNDSPVELGGVVVRDAVRHSGHLGLVVDRQLRVEWETNDTFRQVASLPEEGWKTEPIVAAFEYFRQPWSLSVSVSPRRSRLAVAVDHLLVIDRKSVLWQGRLNFSPQRNPLFSIRLEMPGWTVDSTGIEPATVIDAQDIASRDGTVTIPLQEPADGDVSVTILARRPRRPDETALDIPLPVVQRAASSSGRLTVASPGFLELVPDDIASQGLEPLPAPLDHALPVRVWGPRFLAYRAVSTDLRFVATVAERPPVIRADVTNQVVLHEGSAAVQQSFQWYARSEPVERLQFDVSDDLGGAAAAIDGAAAIDIDAKLDGEPVVLETPPSAASGDNGKQRLEIRLPKPTIGPIRVELRYGVPYQLPEEEDGQRVKIPLIVPVGATEQRAELRMSRAPSAGIAFDVADDATGWIDTGRLDGAEGVHVLESTQSPDHVLLVLRMIPRSSRPDVVVHRAWIQSTALGTDDQTRCVFVIQTRRSEIGFRLPKSADVKIDHVLLDGSIVQYETPNRPGDRRIVISLGGTDTDSKRRLEVTLDHARPQRGGSVRAIVPEFDGVAVFNRVYWQVIVPGNVHLLATPSGWTSENTWCFRGGVSRRVPALASDALAEWVGRNGVETALAGANTYLFGAFRLPPIEQAPMIHQSMLFMFASGASLGMGLILLYVPWLRRTWVILAFATLLAALSLLQPETALLFAQAAVAGVFLAILAVFLKRKFDRERVSDLSVAVSGSSATRLAPATYPLLRAPDGSGSVRTATPTASLHPHDSQR